MDTKYRYIFEPITIRGIDFKNRIKLAPPSPNHADTQGFVTYPFVDWFRQFARGGASVLYVGNSAIDITETRDEHRQLDLGSDTCILPLSWYAEMASAYGCHASLEVNHNGKDSSIEEIGKPAIAPSPIIPWSEKTRAKALGREPVVPIEMTHEKIKETIDKYATACLRMKRAGMDIALVHGGHSNLIAQFLSTLYNKREDEYGGSTAKRARFAIEVCDAIREKCGEDFVIEMRLSADEIVENGMHFEETLEVIDLLKDKVDIFQMSAGIHSDFDMKYYNSWCQNYMLPRGYNVHFARDVKKQFPNVLVTAVGSITDLDMAEEILANKWADFVAICRPLIADPDMPRKYALGHPEDRRPCLRCDRCALRLGAGGGPNSTPRVINCAVNPFSGLTSELKDGIVPKAPSKKKIGIVGGGPAGLYAMMAACDRGHDVFLYEKTDHLGGALVPAAASPLKQDLKDYNQWLMREVSKYPANILLNTKVTKAQIEAESFDALIIAIGAEPVRPNIPGADNQNVYFASETEINKTDVGEKVVIIGAGSIGQDAALDYSNEGKTVEIVELLDEATINRQLSLGIGLGARIELNERLAANDVPIHFESRLDEITSTGVIITNIKTGVQSELLCDSVLLAIGMRPLSEEVSDLRSVDTKTEVFIVGDALKVGNISTATNGGFQAALHL